MQRIVEYIWLGGENELRSKTRVLVLDKNEPLNICQIPDWDYDGSSTKQADTNNSEVIIKPCAIFKDPFRGENDILVLCSTYKPDGTPLSNNHRDWAVKIFDEKPEEEPWYGLEQEYFLLDIDTNLPLSNSQQCHREQGQYYCSNGKQNAFGREVAEQHMFACLNAGINISGINSEVAPSQWEYQVGPCVGIDAADQLWVARYILERITEKHNVYVTLDPKPLGNDWNGSGCHTNYSTKNMRSVGGITEIYDAIHKLSENHDEHMKVYGSGNERRLTGKHETSGFHHFSSGRANRGASIRIGNKTVNDGYGYFEDRRPSSNMDPYLVTAKIFETTTK